MRTDNLPQVLNLQEVAFTVVDVFSRLLYTAVTLHGQGAVLEANKVGK